MSSSHKKIHFIGIGGIGMSALARWFLAQNWLVTGSDATQSTIIQELVKDGIRDYYASRGLGDVYKRQKTVNLRTSQVLRLCKNSKSKDIASP